MLLAPPRSSPIRESSRRMIEVFLNRKVGGIPIHEEQADEDSLDDSSSARDPRLPGICPARLASAV
jgi:hypothetical protein